MSFDCEYLCVSSPPSQKSTVRMSGMEGTPNSLMLPLADCSPKWTVLKCAPHKSSAHQIIVLIISTTTGPNVPLMNISNSGVSCVPTLSPIQSAVPSRSPSGQNIAPDNSTQSLDLPIPPSLARTNRPSPLSLEVRNCFQPYYWRPTSRKNTVAWHGLSSILVPSSSSLPRHDTGTVASMSPTDAVQTGSQPVGVFVPWIPARCL